MPTKLPCKPRILRHYFHKLEAERFFLDPEAKKIRGQITASTSAEVSNLNKDEELPVRGTVTVKGVKGAAVEFEIGVHVTAVFGVEQGTTDDQCQDEDTVHLIMAQLGPLMVVKARELLVDMGFAPRALTFFDPFSGYDETPSDA